MSRKKKKPKLPPHKWFEVEYEFIDRTYNWKLRTERIWSFSMTEARKMVRSRFRDPDNNVRFVDVQ